MAEEFTTSGTVILGSQEADDFAAEIKTALNGDRFTTRDESHLVTSGEYARVAYYFDGVRVGTRRDAGIGQLWRVYMGTSREINFSVGMRRLSYRSNSTDEQYSSVLEAARALLAEIAPAPVQQSASA